MKIDAQKMVHQLGGPKSVSERITAMGHPLKLKTVEMWIFRKSVPGTWMVLLAGLAKKDGVRFDITKYLLEDTKDAKAAAEEGDDLDFLD